MGGVPLPWCGSVCDDLFLSAAVSLLTFSQSRAAGRPVGAPLFAQSGVAYVMCF